MSAHKWAKKFDVADTWLERWATQTVEDWHAHRCLPPIYSESTKKLEMYYQGLRDAQAAEKEQVFNFAISGTPISRLSLGVSMGWPPWWDEMKKSAASRSSLRTIESLRARKPGGKSSSTRQPPAPSDLDIFRELMRAQLDSELDRFFSSMPSETKVKLPENLEHKLECAALYFLCGMKVKELALEFCQSESTIHGWLKETLGLLRLPMKSRGRPKRAKSLLE